MVFHIKQAETAYKNTPLDEKSMMMDDKGALYISEYNKNNCCTIFVIIANILTGFGLVALEITQLTYVWNLPHLKYRIEQYTLFGESCPGIWLGFFFLLTAVAGFTARQTKSQPAQRHVRYSIFATMNVINIVSSKCQSQISQ